MRKYTVWLPLGLSVIIIAIYFLLPVRPVVLGKDGAIAGVLTVLSTLPGFYFAGLAAVATFGSADMDREMPDPAPTVSILVGNAVVTNKLTRRLFLTYLFSYLVLLSLVLCFVLLFLNLAAPSIALWESELHGISYGDDIAVALKFIVGTAVVLMASSLAVSTLPGVFFLTEKMHQP